MNEYDLEKLESEYRNVSRLAEQFCAQVPEQLERLLTMVDISLANPIQHRVKTWDSIQEKLNRVGLAVEKVDDIQDIAGIRLILLFKRDLWHVGQIIRANLDVIREYDTLDRLGADQFGYSSRHFVVKLKADWLAVPTLSSLGGLQAEIQVRTSAQHLWAEASQALQYKNEVSVPNSVLRSVNRVSALLETVDLEFERVLVEREAYKREIRGARGSKATRRLNVDLLESELSRLLPPANRIEAEDYEFALQRLLESGIETIGELRKLVKERLVSALALDARLVTDILENPGEEDLNVERARRGVFFAHTGLVAMMLLDEDDDAD